MRGCRVEERQQYLKVEETDEEREEDGLEEARFDRQRIARIHDEVAHSEDHCRRDDLVRTITNSPPQD